jgi:hypothetical protein
LPQLISVAKPLSWRSLKLGLVTLAGLLLLPVVVIYAPGIGRSTIELYVATNDATGVIRGTEVWLSGERIGKVEETELRPVSTDTSQRVLVRVTIMRDLAPRIRRDTRAQIRPGTSMVGTPVVYLSGGSRGAAAIRAGDTLIAQPQTAFDETRAAIAAGIAQLPALKADVESLTTQLFSQSGTIGAVNTRQPSDQRITVLDALTHDLRRRTHVNKPVALVDSARDALSYATNHAIAASDSLRHLLFLAGGTLNRLESDSALLRAIRGVRNEIDTTQRLLTTPVGTVGRLRTDSALHHQVREASRSLPF